jgi:hypothetical protein
MSRDGEAIVELSQKTLSGVRVASPETRNLVRSREPRADGLEIAGGDLS